ncbi:MAG TPA: serine hydrolase [Bacteroidia bacterium]|nr:serine hydrolase [Bacteroidia bacterium]HNT79528.1 serine hydrolase [Bacteroidia bacterium]
MRRLLLLIIFIVSVLVFLLQVSGNGYIIRALVYNYVDIDDYKIFSNRVIDAHQPKAWKKSLNYNEKKLTPVLQEHLSKTNSVAFVVIQNKELCYEWYAPEFSDSSLSSSFSMAKSYVSAMIGVALAQKKIKSLDEPIANYVPEFNEGDQSKITIRHALQMSTGLDWDETYASLFNPVTKAYYGKNLFKQVISLNAVTKPGVEYNYQSCNTQLLGFVLEKATGKSLSEYLSENIWSKTESEHSALWSLDHKDGHEKAYSAIYSNARDFARLGQLYLDSGRWNGQQLIPEDYVLESIVPAPLLDQGKPNKVYGYQWWCDQIDGANVFYARGILGQYIFVIPSINLVCVRLGHERSEQRDENGKLIETDVYFKELTKVFKQNNPSMEQ